MNYTFHVDGSKGSGRRRSRKACSECRNRKQRCIFSQHPDEDEEFTGACFQCSKRRVICRCVPHLLTAIGYSVNSSAFNRANPNPALRNDRRPLRRATARLASVTGLLTSLRRKRGTEHRPGILLRDHLLTGPENLHRRLALSAISIPRRAC